MEDGPVIHRARFFLAVLRSFTRAPVALFGALVVFALAPSLGACTNAPAPDLVIVPDGSALVAGTQLQLIANRHYSDGSVENVTRVVDWSTSDGNSLKLVSPELSPGLVAAVSPTSNVFITARDPESGVTTTSTFSVVASVLRRIDINPSPALSLAHGQSRALTALGTFSDGTQQDVTQSVQWSSSNEQVADVGNLQGMRGVATANAPGSTSISAEDAVTGILGSTLIFVGEDIPVLEAIVITPNPEQIGVGKTTKFAASAVFSDGSTSDVTQQVSWVSSSTSVATIDATGLATGLAAGDVTITASENGTDIRGSASLTVTP